MQNKLRPLRPGEKIYFIKVDQPGRPLYVHPCDDGGYQVLDKKEGAAVWFDEAGAILMIKGLEQTNPERKFKLELMQASKKL